MARTLTIDPVPSVGQAAPDIELPGADGTAVRLSELWRLAERGTILVFFRHFG